MKRVFNNILDFLSTFRGKVVMAIVVLAVGCSVSIAQNRAAIKTANEAAANAQKAADSSAHALRVFKQESRVRRDQACEKQEREYINAVHGLKITYNYLADLPKEEVTLSFNQVIIREMPRGRQEAKLKTPTPYCHEKGIGLDKKIPDFPQKRDFSHLLVKQLVH